MLDKIGIEFVGNHITTRLITTRVFSQCQCHKTIFGMQSVQIRLEKWKSNCILWMCHFDEMDFEFSITIYASHISFYDI